MYTYIYLILVRELFSNLTNLRFTIKQLLIPLSPDHIRKCGTPETQQSAFRTAFEFLKEVALLAYETTPDSKGIPALLNEAPISHQNTISFIHRYSGDIRNS